MDEIEQIRVETQPLLSRNSAAAARQNNGTAHPQLQIRPLILICLFSLLADVGGHLVETPETRLLEMAVCRDYYREHDPGMIGPPPLAYVRESACKLNAIQSKLAYLRATKFLIGMVPGVLLAFLYGRLSDRIGRKPVLLLGLTGQVLGYFWLILVCYFHETLPTIAVLVAPVFALIGGGVRVLIATTKAVIVDATPEDMRTTVLYLVTAGVLVANIVATPIGSWLLSQDLWLPWKFNTPIILLAFPVLFAMPETLPRLVKLADSGSTHATEQHGQEQSTPTEEPRARADDSEAPDTASSAQALRSLVKRAFSSFAINKSILICLAISLSDNVARQAQSVFIQYTSKVLDWPISAVGYILSVQAAVSLGLLVGLAGITRCLHAKAVADALYVDMFALRCSTAISILANTLIGIGNNPATLISGKLLEAATAPSGPALSGIIVTYADSDVAGRVYASVAFVEIIAGVGGLYLFAVLFQAGLELHDDGGAGLPFLISALVFVIPLSLSLCLSSSASSNHRTTAST